MSSSSSSYQSTSDQSSSCSSSCSHGSLQTVANRKMTTTICTLFFSICAVVISAIALTLVSQMSKDSNKAITCQLDLSSNNNNAAAVAAVASLIRNIPPYPYSSLQQSDIPLNPMSDAVNPNGPRGVSHVFNFSDYHVERVSSEWGEAMPATYLNYPITRGLATSQTRFILYPHGCNPPHEHPNAVETLYVFMGRIRVVIVEPNFGTKYEYILEPDMTVVFPRGFIHFQHNIGSGNASYISTLNSDNPGVLTIATRTCQLPYEVLASSFGLKTKDAITQLCSNLPSGIIHYQDFVYTNTNTYQPAAATTAAAAATTNKQ